MNCGEKIAKLRREKNLTQAELGRQLNVTYQAVSKWERGESYPDFETIVRMAKIFRVKVEYFSEGGEVEEEVSKKRQVVVGTCSMCGKTMRKSDVGTDFPKLLCTDCVAYQNRKKHVEEQERLYTKQEEEEKAAYEAARMKKALTSRRTRGFVWGAIVSTLALLLGVLGSSQGKPSVAGAVWGFAVVLFIFGFLTVSQVVWGGAVHNVVMTGGKIVGTPGVIFTFDLDGFIFLIAIKILFAIIRLAIFVVTLVFFVLIGALISPFTFAPCLTRLTRDIAKGEDSLDEYYFEDDGKLWGKEI